LLALFVAADISITTGPRLQQGMGPRLPSGHASGDYHLVAHERYSDLPSFPVRAIGTTECYGGFDWPVSRALWVGGPQERLEPPDAGTVARLRWSPNSILFRVTLTRPATLVVDQNFHSGWRASESVPVARDGLLALPLTAGERDVILRHRPAGVVPGLMIAPTRVAAMRARLRRALVGPE
jgi:hypothetical protein